MKGFLRSLSPEKGLSSLPLPLQATVRCKQVEVKHLGGQRHLELLPETRSTQLSLLLPASISAASGMVSSARPARRLSLELKTCLAHPRSPDKASRPFKAPQSKPVQQAIAAESLTRKHFTQTSSFLYFFQVLTLSYAFLRAWLRLAAPAHRCLDETLLVAS